MRSAPPSDIRDYLSYAPDTGVFTWVKRPGGGNARAGGEAGETDRQGYRTVTFRGERYRAHRLAWFFHYGEWPSAILDHINGQRDDNRICNLRAANAQLNGANMVSNNRIAKGVTIERSGRYRARIYPGGRPRSLGCYDTPEEAHAAYCKAAVEHYGEFARFQ